MKTMMEQLGLNQFQMNIQLNIMGALKDNDQFENIEMEEFSIGWKLGNKMFETEKFSFKDNESMSKIKVVNQSFETIRINTKFDHEATFY